uniref:anti-CBASS 4 (Acb4) n=1 Tax=Bacillus phage SP01 TaxID=2884427 RepID=UPI0039A3F8A9
SMKINAENFECLRESKLKRKVYEDLVKEATFVRVSPKSTVCVVTDHNSFEVIGTSSVYKVENFNDEIGRDTALSQALDSFIKFLAYSGELSDVLENI